MKILIISQYFYPENFLINDIAFELARTNEKVVVITGLPNYPWGKCLKDYKPKSKRKEIINGVEVYRCFETNRKNSAISLSINYLSFVMSASRQIKKINGEFDFVFCYQVSPITQAIPVLKYKKKNKNIPTILYCLDLFPESVKSHVKDGGLIYKLVHRISKKIYNSFDKIAVTSESFIPYLTKVNNVQNNKIFVLHQHGVDFQNKSIKKEENSKKIFLFAGNIGYAQNLEVIIKAVESIKQYSDFVVMIIGDGSRLEYIKKIVQDKKIDDHFVFLGRKNREELMNLYAAADVLLLTLRGDNYVCNTIPGKFQSYLSVGKPIFAAINGDTAKLINKSKCGLSVESDDYKGLSILMRDYLNNPSNFECYGDNSRKLFEKEFTLDAFIKRLMEIIDL